MAFVTGLIVHSCADPEPESGDELRFVACESNLDCERALGQRYACEAGTCVERSCTATACTDASAPDGSTGGGAGANGGSGAGGSSGSGGAGGAFKECRPPLVADAGDVAMLECSSSVLQVSFWGFNTCLGPYNPPDPGCPARWGCGTYETALEAIAWCDFNYVTPDAGFFYYHHVGRASGFLVIGEFGGPDTTRTYYDESTGEMVGYYQVSDAGDIACSGRIPEDAFGTRQDEGITDRVSLCAADGGLLGDAGDAGP